MKYRIFCILILLASYAHTQTPALEGTWKGVCYQEGGMGTVKAEYFFTLNLVKTGKTTFDGTSIIEFKDDPKVFGVIQLSAKWEDNHLKIQEFKIQEEQGATYFSWCIKKYNLTLQAKETELQGAWTGSVAESVCNPGTIRVKKTVSQAVQNFETQTQVIVPSKESKTFDSQVHAQERQTLILKNIHFQPNKTEIRPESYPELAKLSSFLHKNPRLQVRINGHTDKGGTLEFNQRLSEGRALAVKNYLILQGVTGNRISTAGFGGTKPIADNETIEGRALNRRVELEILGYSE